jgi:hypothetical protein
MKPSPPAAQADALANLLQVNGTISLTLPLLFSDYLAA